MSTGRDDGEREWLRSVGAAVRARRLQLGLSQEQLGFRSGLDRTYVSGVERGRRNPTLLVVLKLAHALQTTPSDLLRGIERM